MRFGKLFKLLQNIPTLRNMEFSGNRFSLLSYAECRTIARELNAYGFWSLGDYTHFTTEELRSSLYNNVKNLYDTRKDEIEAIGRNMDGFEEGHPVGLGRFEED